MCKPGLRLPALLFQPFLGEVESSDGHCVHLRQGHPGWQGAQTQAWST